MAFTDDLNPNNIPKVDKTLGLICGIIDFFLFGIGTIVVGLASGSINQVIIGILQLVIPFVGWLWSIIWGIFILKSVL